MAISNGFCLIYWGSCWSRTQRATGGRRPWHRWKWRRWALPWFLCISSSMASTLPSSELTAPALLMDSGVVVQQPCTITLLAAIGTVFVRDPMSMRAQGWDYAGASAWRWERPPSCSAIKLNPPVACSLSTDGDEMGRTWATREWCEIALLTGIMKGGECGRLRLEKNRDAVCSYGLCAWF